MTRSETFERIADELRRAEEARRRRLDGRLRVCARRAAGHALTWWLEMHPHPDWPRTAFGRLRAVRDDEETFPPAVREAARLLTLTVPPRADADNLVLEIEREAVRERVERMKGRETVPPGLQPLEVAQVIIDWIDREMSETI